MFVDTHVRCLALSSAICHAQVTDVGNSRLVVTDSLRKCSIPLVFRSKLFWFIICICLGSLGLVKLFKFLLGLRHSVAVIPSELLS